VKECEGCEGCEGCERGASKLTFPSEAVKKASGPITKNITMTAPVIL
jgi:hypothetical protein